jgi:hypothetical protein
VKIRFLNLCFFNFYLYRYVGEDFPKCPYRPTARFVELAVGDATEEVGGAGGKSLAEELGMRDEAGLYMLNAREP